MEDDMLPLSFSVDRTPLLIGNYFLRFPQWLGVFTVVSIQVNMQSANVTAAIIQMCCDILPVQTFIFLLTS